MTCSKHFSAKGYYVLKTIQVLRKWATSQSIYHFSWDLFTLGYQVLWIIIISKNVSSGVESQLLYANYQVLLILRHIRLLLSPGCMVPSILFVLGGFQFVSILNIHTNSCIFYNISSWQNIMRFCHLNSFFIRCHINNIIKCESSGPLNTKYVL